jgi:hypothetical protein
MKPHSLFVMTVLGVVVASSHLMAQQRDRGNRSNDRDDDRVCFYRDVEFQGPSWCYNPGDELADLGGRDNEFSSVRIFGRARVIVYDLEEFAGAADEFDMDVADLRLRNMEGSRNWNDRIESFQVVSGAGRRRGGPFGRDRDDERDNRPSRDRVCVYDAPNYGGRSQCWEAGQDERNLNRVSGWNDRISSIRVFGRARVELYRDADYRGERLRLDRDQPDLGAINWGDQISSFQIR